MGLQCQLQDHDALRRLFQTIWRRLLHLSGPQLLQLGVQDQIPVDCALIQQRIVEGLVETGYKRYREWFTDSTEMSSGEEYTGSDSEIDLFETQ
jgi:hypothetical protein